MADGTTVKRLQVVFDTDTKPGTKALQDMQQETTKSSGFFDKAKGALVGFATGFVALEVGKAAFDFLKDSVQSYMASSEEMQANEKQTQAVLASTGGMAGVTAGMVDDLATNWSKIAPYSDEAVHSAENVLLTFRNVGKDVFPQATGAILDMATAMHMDLNSATLQVGKALDDPVKGMVALRREGVTFTKDQIDTVKAMVKTGDVMGAQKIILGELSKEFGGSATAAGQTFQGALTILNNQFDQMKQKIGGPILDGLTKMIDAVLPLVPLLGQGLAGAAGLISEAFKKIVPFVGSVAELLGEVLDVGVPLAASFLSGLKPSLDALFQGFGGVSLSMKDVNDWMMKAYQWVDSLRPLTGEASTMGKTVGTDVVGAFKTLKEIWDKVEPGAEKLGNFVKDVMQKAWKELWPDIQIGAKALEDFGASIETKALPAAKAIWGWIQQAMPIIEAIWNATWPAMSATLGAVWQVIKGVIEVAFALISGTFKFWLDVISGNWKGAWQDVLDMLKGVGGGLADILGGLVQIVITGVSGMTLAALNLLGNMPGDFGTAAKNAGKAMGDGLGNMGGYVAQAAKNLAKSALGAIKDALGIKSPSKEFGDIGVNSSLGFVQGLKSVDVASASSDHFGSALDRVSGRMSSRTGGVSAYGSGAAAASASAGSGRMLRVSVELDSRELARVVAPATVDEIRLSTGVMS